MSSEQIPEPVDEQPLAPRESRPRGGGNLGSTVTAAAATFTAVVALAIALWDNVQTRKHNRLSVLPYVVLQRSHYDSSGLIRGELAMSNEGVGPAILQGLEIGLPTEAGRDTVFTTWGDASPLIRRYGAEIRGWAEVDSGVALGVQRNSMLLRLQAEGDSGAIRINRLLDALRLRLRYASIYGQHAEATIGDW
ncbi:MAG TPA: hypothetical protein VFX98_13795 [Longimicrobiaceae bacterium]|nr:hypothetical protein [Longimicrobiaceae bacterium]